MLVSNFLYHAIVFNKNWKTFMDTIFLATRLKIFIIRLMWQFNFEFEKAVAKQQIFNSEGVSSAVL